MGVYHPGRLCWIPARPPADHDGAAAVHAVKRMHGGDEGPQKATLKPRSMRFRRWLLSEKRPS